MGKMMPRFSKPEKEITLDQLKTEIQVDNPKYLKPDRPLDHNLLSIKLRIKNTGDLGV